MKLKWIGCCVGVWWFISSAYSAAYSVEYSVEYSAEGRGLNLFNMARSDQVLGDMVDKVEILHQDDSEKFSDFIVHIQTADVVIVGEYHDDWVGHLWQWAILNSLAKNRPWSVGVEWLPQTKQAVMNDFMAGKLSEFQFLQASDYVNRWGFDYRLLKPILDMAKQRSIPFYALNAPKEWTQKVSKKGLESLTPNERQQFPHPLLPLSEKYKKRLTHFFEHLSAEKQRKSLMIQSIWDQTMAQSIQAILQKHPQQKMLVFAGMVHAGKGQGIADALQALMPNKKILTVGYGRFDGFEPEDFDYYALLSEVTETLQKPPKLPPVLTLGIVFSKKSEMPQGLEIESIVPNSWAEKIGVRPGDKLQKIAHYSITTYADLKSALWLVSGQPKIQITWQTEDVLLGYPEIKTAVIMSP